MTTAATSCASFGRATRDGRTPSTVYASIATCSVITRLDPHAVGERALDALRRDRCTGVAAGEDLSRIHHTVGIEGRARALHRLEVLGPEDPEHEVVLLEADPVLARKRAAGVDRDLQDLGARLHDPSDRLSSRVEEQHRMEVPVADMEH